MNRDKKSLKALYANAKEAVVGSEITCPSCGTVHKKTAYNTVFCKTKGGTVCKDNYWNNVTPTKRNNKTRISPASKAWLSNPDRITGYTSEGYRIIGGVAYNEWDEPVYDVNPYDDTHPFDVGDAGDKDR